jgi:hypothetical protein
MLPLWSTAAGVTDGTRQVIRRRETVAGHEAVHKGEIRSSQAGVPVPSNQAEAEQRIDAAKRGNERVLDLSGLRLKDIPSELVGLRHLRELPG